MPTVVIATPPYLYFSDNNGNPLSGGKIETYLAGTTTPQATYTDASGTVANTNPVVCDSSGRAVIFLDNSVSYKYIVKDSLGTIIRTVDNITPFTASGSIASGSVTNAMLANMAANTVKVRAASTSGVPSDLSIGASQLVGRGSTGDMAAITLGTNLSMSGTTLNAAGGGVVQRKYAQIGTVVSCGTIPADNTIPQISEGTEVLSLSITPTSATNRLRISFSAFGDASSGTGINTLAVFRDAVTDALCAKGYGRGDGSVVNGGNLVFEYVAGTTSAVTISARAGNSTGTLYINGNSAGTAFYGGVGFSTLVVEELTA